MKIQNVLVGLYGSFAYWVFSIKKQLEISQTQKILGFLLNEISEFCQKTLKNQKKYEFLSGIHPTQKKLHEKVPVRTTRNSRPTQKIVQNLKSYKTYKVGKKLIKIKGLSPYPTHI